MEIGSPTDVKHVTHIGCDITTTTSLRDHESNSFIDWETLLASEFLSVPSSTSWTQFDDDDELSKPTTHHLPNNNLVHH